MSGCSTSLTILSALQAVYAELLRQCFNTYKAVRGNAVGAVMAACKRFPCLAPLGLAVAVRAVARLPQLRDADMQAWLRGDGSTDSAFAALLEEVSSSRQQPSLPAPAAASAAGSRFLLMAKVDCEEEPMHSDKLCDCTTGLRHWAFVHKPDSRGQGTMYYPVPIYLY